MANDTTTPGGAAAGNSIGASERVETFIRALHGFERSGDAGDLLRLFAGDCELQHKPREDLYRGPDGALQFWQSYRAQFDSVRSLFTHIIEADNSAVLEWYSEGKLPAASKGLRYSGVSVLEFDGDERVKRFRTYYDSAVFLLHRDAPLH